MEAFGECSVSKGGLGRSGSMAGEKPQGQALRVLACSLPCPFPPATLHLQVAKAERRSASGGALTEKALPTETDIDRHSG